jgi:catechol 2,3-dioxygenase-like lactoylglutathione lyase family enzyme
MNGIAFVIHTDRFQDSLTFYRDVLELDLVEEWHEGGHGAVLSLTADAEIELIELDVEPGSHGGVALGLEVDDVDSWYDRLTEREVAVKAPPIDALGKRGFGTTDPNGVAVNIYTTRDAYH